MQYENLNFDYKTFFLDTTPCLITNNGDKEDVMLVNVGSKIAKKINM